MPKSVQVRIYIDAKDLLEKMADRAHRSATNYLSWLVYKMAEENKDQSWLNSLMAEKVEDPCSTDQEGPEN